MLSMQGSSTDTVNSINVYCLNDSVINDVNHSMF